MKMEHYPSPVLKSPTEAVDDPADVAGEIEAMVRVMHENKGVGLAANQVGIGKRFFVMNVDNEIGRASCRERV